MCLTPGLLTLGVSAGGCARLPSCPQPAELGASAPISGLESLAALARLHGLVRYFHPSDAAAEADWDAKIIAGARALLDCSDRRELQATLLGWLASVAPTVAIYAEDQVPPEPSLAGRGPQVYWQHEGLGERPQGPYSSVRKGRTRSPIQSRAWASVTHTLDVTQLSARSVRISVDIRTVGRDSRATLFALVSRPLGTVGASSRSSASSSAWHRMSLDIDLAEDATVLSFGVDARGGGAVEARGFSLERLDDTRGQALPLDDPKIISLHVNGWTLDERGYGFAIVDDPATAGGTFVRASAEHVELSEPLFRARPEANEVRDLPLGAGLRVRLPVSLPDSLARRGSDNPSRDAPLPDDLDDPAVRVAMVCVGWSSLRHFFPNFDEIDADWEAVLERSLADILAARGEAGVRAALERMLAPLADGHARVIGFEVETVASVSLTRAEGKVVVVAAGEGVGLAPGDVVLRIDGVDIERAVAKAATQRSGSPQWIEAVVLREGLLSAGPPNTTVRFVVEREGQRLHIEAARERWPGGWPAPAQAAYQRFDDGVIYIDLVRESWDQIEPRLSELLDAPGLVFDLRGYPEAPIEVLLRHLLRRREHVKWMFVPQVIYPNQRCVGWRELGWQLRPQGPRLEAKVAFITDARAISAVESFLAYVEGHGLGAIIGGPTAGANGNMSFIELPTGYALSFSGMKVRRHDGSPLHGRGILPTIPAEPTIAGIRAGRDELIELALATVRTSGRTSGRT